MSVVDAPLSHGQLYSWREIETYPAGWEAEANLPALWDLRGHPLAAVDTALRQLLARHETLRTTYRLADGTPVQRVHPELPLPVTRVDRQITDHGDPERTTAALVGTAIPMTDSVGWRGELVTTDGEPMFLSLAFSHTIVDVWSVIRLQEEFHALLAGAGAAPAGEPARPAPRELALRDGRARHDGAERYWRRVLEGAPPALPTLGWGETRERIQATLHSRRLGGLLALAARRHGVTPPAVLMALVTAALTRHLGTDGITLSVMSNNRFAPARRDVVGTMNQLIPVPVTVDGTGTVAGHVRRVHWAAAKAYRHSGYNVDRIMGLVAGDAPHGCRFNRLFPAWFNYLQFDDRPCDPEDTGEAEVVWTPRARRYGQPFDVRVTVQDGGVAFALRVDPEVVDAHALTGILRAVADGTRIAATEPDTGLAELWRSDVALPAELFPAEITDPPQDHR